MKLITHNIRAIVYSLIITLSYLFLNNIIRSGSSKELMIGLAISIIIFILAIYTTLFRARDKLKQFGMPAVKRYSLTKEYTYHLILPLAAFISFFSQIYFNSFGSFLSLLLVVIFFLFFTLFINIRSYYEDKFNLEISSHFVYSIISILTIFSSTNGILTLTKKHDLPILVATFLLFILYMLLINLIIIEFILKQLIAISYTLAFSVLSTVVVITLFTQFDFNIRSSFISCLLAYFTIAIVHHKTEGTLNKSLLFEYFAIFLLSLVLLFGIS